MQMQCKHDDGMPTSCKCKVNHDDMMSCHVIPTLHQWNANSNDAMLTWFTLYANPTDIMFSMCNMHAHAWYMFPKYFWHT